MTDIVDVISLGFTPSRITHKVDLAKTREPASV